MGAVCASERRFPFQESGVFCGENVERWFPGQGRVRYGTVEMVGNIVQAFALAPC